MKIDKIKEIVLLLVAIILGVYLIKYLKLFSYINRLLNILVPLFIGFIYAWIFNPLISKLSLKYSRNVISILLFLIFILLFSLFIYFLVPLFYKEIMEFIGIIPEYFNKIEVRVEAIGFKKYLDRMVSFIVNNVPSYLIDLVGSIFKNLGVVIIGLILGLYISIDYEKIVKNMYDFIPKKFKCVTINLLQEVSGEVRKCVNGTLLIAMLVFAMDSLCFLFIGIDSPVLLGMVCGITDLIPYVGPYIGGLIAVLVGFTESKILGVLTLVSCFLVQSVENYVLQPIVMSKSIKISPILIIVGLLVFGNLFGIVGMIFATPVMAMLKVLFTKFNIVIKKCRKNAFDFKYE